jgi:alkylhydroperoxidase family enzyme
MPEISDAHDSSASALARFAPEAATVVSGLETAAWQAMADAELLELFDLATHVVAAQNGAPALARPSQFGAGSTPAANAAAWRKRDGLTQADRAALGFAEQMSFNVASFQAEQRSALFSELGAAALPFTQAIYIADMRPRAGVALRALFDESDESVSGDPAPAAEGDLGHLVNELIRVVPGLQAIDAVTTELVRLLGAKHHRCRVCLSVRSHSAMSEGADDAMFDAVESYATSAFPDAQKAALAFAEAMIASPMQIDSALAGGLLEHYSPAACVELVLDITRNATNKVAVALGGDAPRVETGYEVYDVRPDGEIVYGLEAPQAG